MTGADGRADRGARRGWRWDVALSFAGAQRAYVERVAGELKAFGVRCFYDADEQIDLWGKYLAEELPTIFGEEAAAVVMFVSAEYAARDWTRPERRAALARAVRERREYVLPARFDDTPLPGLQSEMVWVDLRGRTPSTWPDCRKHCSLRWSFWSRATPIEPLSRGCGEHDQALLAIDGIVVAELGGKDILLLPCAILTLLGVPCLVVFDGDKGSADLMRRDGKQEADILDVARDQQRRTETSCGTSASRSRTGRQLRSRTAV